MEPNDYHRLRRALRGLAQRWFIQYNPLYLISAALVLAGVLVISEGLSRQDGQLAGIGLTAITELYQILLVGSVALLYRIGQRRPAVMLALLEAAYLCDLTCQTGAAAFLGTAGVLQSLAWLGLTVAKLFALAWALRLRLSRSAALVPIVGAVALAGLPHLLVAGVLPPHRASALLGLCVFGIGAAKLWSRCAVSSELDEGGRSVLRRAVSATWIIWAVLGLCHLAWLCSDFELSAYPMLTAVGLLATARWCRRERWVWVAVLGAVVQSAVLGPEVLSPVALMAALVLVLRGWRPPVLQRARPVAPLANHPYRIAPAELRPDRLLVAVAQSWRRPEARRYYTGALVAVYLVVWAELAWPQHLLSLDVVLSAALLAVVWRSRQALALLPLALCWGHLLVQRGLVTAPGSAVGWGGLIVAVGFAALLFGLAINWLARGGAPAGPADVPAVDQPETS